MFTTAKLSIIFHSNKLFQVNMRIWRPLITFMYSLSHKFGGIRTNPYLCSRKFVMEVL